MKTGGTAGAARSKKRESAYFFFLAVFFLAFFFAAIVDLLFRVAPRSVPGRASRDVGGLFDAMAFRSNVPHLCLDYRTNPRFGARATFLLRDEDECNPKS